MSADRPTGLAHEPNGRAIHGFAVACAQKSLATRRRSRGPFALITSRRLPPRSRFLCSNLLFHDIKVHATRQKLHRLFEGGRADFQILDQPINRFLFRTTINQAQTAEGVQHSLDSVDLWPIRSSDVREFLSRAGFRKITLFSNARLARFGPKTSTDLFVVAMK